MSWRILTNYNLRVCARLLNNHHSIWGFFYVNYFLFIYLRLNWQMCGTAAYMYGYGLDGLDIVKWIFYVHIHHIAYMSALFAKEDLYTRGNTIKVINSSLVVRIKCLFKLGEKNSIFFFRICETWRRVVCRLI